MDDLHRIIKIYPQVVNKMWINLRKPVVVDKVGKTVHRVKTKRKGFRRNLKKQVKNKQGVWIEMWIKRCYYSRLCGS